MTLSEIAGISMLIAPFLLLFLWIARDSGVGTAILIFGGTFMLGIWGWTIMQLLTR